MPAEGRVGIGQENLDAQRNGQSFFLLTYRRMVSCLLCVPPFGHASPFPSSPAPLRCSRSLSFAETKERLMDSWTKDILKDRPSLEGEECQV